MTWSFGWSAVLVPNLAMMINHARGGRPAHQRCAALFNMELPKILDHLARARGLSAFVGVRPGGSPIIFNAIIKHFGYHGLFVFPFVALSMEKSFYDTALCLRGIDPNKRAECRQGEGFPSGGHLLPSFSLVACRDHAITLRDFLPASLFPNDSQ
jgi:hypothetical protein